MKYKKFYHLLIALSGIFFYFSLTAQESANKKVDVFKMQEFNQRDGLPNVFRKIATQRLVRIGYIGGSITAARDGWHDLTFSNYYIIKSCLNKTNVGISFLMIFASACSSEKERNKPNIVILYADDMDYGDVNIQNPDSKIPTPNLDNLASEGIRFTDAHSSSGIFSPSRFAMLTGTYHWRRQHDIVNSFEKPFFNESDITLPQVLKENGYTTACFGKWHLGWNWEFKNEPSGLVTVNDIDWSKPISGGPLDLGFEYNFGDGTINFPHMRGLKMTELLKLRLK